MKLTAENVTAVLMDCLYADDESHTNAKLVNGVRLNVGVHPERVEKHRADIESMLAQLPETFRKEVGGGWSFLNACMTKDGEHWGEQHNVDELVCLGIAIGKLRLQMPREKWYLFPGGVPYFVIT